MVFRGKCEVCSGTNFNIEDGYYYCTECNTQNRTVMEMECDNFDLTMGDEKIKVRGVKLQAEKEPKVELTSWEEYNYIMLGLVNEALALGAPPELKKVVFQLWSRYLQKVNAAFFTKSEPALPKLPTNFFKKDACLLYNASRKRRRSTSSVSTKSSKPPATKRALKLAQRKLQNALMKEQLALSSQTSQTTETPTSITNSSVSGSTAIPLAFTSLARKALKRRMPKGHIKKHASDAEHLLTCHSKSPGRNTLNERLEKVSKNVLLSILYIGLNLTGSEIQLGDMLRLAREGHISVFRIDHFFPPNILKNMKRSSFINFQAKYSFPTHSYLRTVTGKLCKQLGVKDLKKPDFVSLVKRYVRELCLPEEMGKYLGRLINFQPPEMNFNYTGMCPNYEARAIGYVIFMLKWLFGLDDTSEEKMSEAAGQVNAKLRNFRPFMPDVFDFVEWMKYIEMRSIVLAEYHMPTSIATKIEGNTENTQKYLEYLNFCKRPGLTTQRSIANSIFNIFEKLSLMHNESDDQRSQKKSFSFAPSMTPFTTYFDFLLIHHGEALEIPKFMEIDHSKRTIDPLFRPNRFRNLLIKHGINVCLRKCPESEEMITVQRTKQVDKMQDLLVSVEIVSDDEDCDYQDFGKELEEAPKKSKHQVRKKQKTNKKSSETSSKGLKKIQKVVPQVSAEPSEGAEKSSGLKKFRKQGAEGSAEQSEEIEEPFQGSEITLEESMVPKTKGFKKFRKEIPAESAGPSEDPKEPSLSSEVLRENNMDPGEKILEEPRRNLDQIFMFDDLSDSDDEIRPGSSAADQEMEFFIPHHQYWVNFIPHKPTDWNIRMESFQELLDKLPSSFTWLLHQCSVLTGIDERTIYIELLTIEKQFTYVLESPDQMTNMVLLQGKEAKKNISNGCNLFWNFW